MVLLSAQIAAEDNEIIILKNR